MPDIGIRIVVDDTGAVKIHDVNNRIIADSKKVDAAYKKVRASQDAATAANKKYTTASRRTSQAYVRLGRDAERFNRVVRQQTVAIKETAVAQTGLMMKMRALRWHMFTLLFLGYALKRMFEAVITPVIEFEKAETALSIAMKKQGVYTKSLINEQIRWADVIGDLTGLHTREVMTLEATIRSYGVEESQVKRTVAAAIDLYIWRSKVLGQNLSLAASGEILGKSNRDVTNQLRRHGIVIDKNITSMSKLEQVLGQIESMMGGVAAVYGRTMAGITDRMRKSFEDQAKLLGPATAKFLSTVALSILGWEFLIVTSLRGLTEAAIGVIDALGDDVPLALLQTHSTLQKLGNETEKQIGLFKELYESGASLDEWLAAIGGTLENVVLPKFTALRDEFEKLTTTSAEKELKRLMGLLTNLEVMVDEARGMDRGLGIEFGVISVGTKEEQLKKIKDVEEELLRMQLDRSEVISTIDKEISRIARREQKRNLGGFIKMYDQMNEKSSSYYEHSREMAKDNMEMKRRFLELEADEHYALIDKISENDQERFNHAAAINEKLKVDIQKLEDAYTEKYGKAFDAMSIGFKGVVDGWGTASEQMEHIGNKTASILSSGIGQGLFDIASGTKDVGDAFSDMALDIAQSIQRVVTEMIAQQLIEALLRQGKAILIAYGYQQAAAESAVTDALVAEGVSVKSLIVDYKALALAKALAGIAGAALPTAASASGAMISRPGLGAAPGQMVPNVTSMASFATGGVVKKTTLGILAETPASRPEIVSPEPLLRKIVRQESGGGSPNIVVKLENKSSSRLDVSSGGVKFDGKNYITSVILEDLNSRGPIAGALHGRR